MQLKELIEKLNDALLDADLSELEHTIVERQMDCI